MNREELKKWSKDKIKGNVLKIFAACIIVSLITSITIEVESEVAGLAITISFALVGYILQIGLTKFMVNFINDKKHEIEMIFEYFKDWKRIIVSYLYQMLNIFLWALLFVVPGIIKSFGYSLVPYILAEDDKISAKDAIKLSEEMMNGHKADLFMLQLSFIGWHLLSVFTLFLLEIWVIPYQQTATTKFLYEIKNNYKKAN